MRQLQATTWSSAVARTSRARLSCDERNPTQAKPCWARETRQKTHKQLKAELQRHASSVGVQEPPNGELKMFILVDGVNTRRLNISTKPQQATAALAQSWLG